MPDTFAIYAQIKTSGTWADPLMIAHESSNIILSDYPAIYTVSGNVSYSTNEYAYSITGGLITVSGTANPGDSTDNWYLLAIHYKTKDGAGNLTNDLRLSERWQITDIDNDYIETNLSYL